MANNEIDSTQQAKKDNADIEMNEDQANNTDQQDGE